MKNYKFFFCLLLLLSAMAMPVSAQVVSNDNEDEVNKVDKRMTEHDYVAGQVLVKFKDQNRVNIRRAKGKFLSADRNAVNDVLQKYGTEEMEQLLPREKAGRPLRKAKAFNGTTIAEKDLSQLYCVKMSEEHSMEVGQLVDELKVLDEVEFAEPNYRLYTLDDVICNGYAGNPLVTNQWYLSAYGVNQLWTKPIINAQRPVIAILDTGVDITHPDLVDNIWTNEHETNGEEGYDNDNNGFKNDLHGWDFINQTNNIHDFNMHGTHVAGIAAASNNGLGIIGANPLAYIMPVTVMQSDGTGDVATIIRGIDYAIANGATILNFSLGTYANSSALRQALERAYQSAVIVAAAGNDGRCVYSSHKHIIISAPMFPAAYSFVLGVQATTQIGSLAGFSNYDDNGPNFSSESTFSDPDGFNYELKAPGVNMLSTIPGGNYKVLNGTSMAAPLVAGAISALKMVKEYDSQEILWGDLLHTDNIAQAYNMSQRPAELDLMRVMYRERKELSEETEEDYSGDGRIDAGETISLYPVIRTTFGEASNIKMRLEMGDEYEDPDVVEILTGEVDFGMHLDAYGKGVSVNPLQLKVADNVANGRHIKMKIVVTCDESNVTYEGHFTMVVDNMIKLSGMITEDLTLTADHEYLVSSNLGIPSGVTLTIEPGTVLRFNDNTSISNAGTLIADGTSEKPIIMMPNERGRWKGVSYATLRFCKLYSVDPTDNLRSNFENCILSDFSNGYLIQHLTGRGISSRTNLIDSYCGIGWFTQVTPERLINCNFINNSLTRNFGGIGPDNNIARTPTINWVNNFSKDGLLFGYESSTPITLNEDAYPYFGTSSESVLRPYIYELGRGNTFAWYDLTNMRKEPVREAHGIVWKVVVNGYDAQDEFEQLPPLGVGRHKFEVYFNRPMNKEVAPHISFGVRDPYTQQAVAEDGSWNEEGTIYTAYKTITGKTKSDGLNRIYVYGAEDDEYFEIPYEKSRFNINIQAAGSMATGFAAEAGLGKVELTWNNDENNFEDAMGFNIYRYTEETIDNPTRINEEIVDIETTTYTDYEVTPGTTYYYMYKVLSTDLQEYDVSNVVAVTPLTGELGDANGSGEVDVADVITTVNYAAGQHPKPFIFEAADMNSDLSIDILDVIGIIKKIINPESVTTTMAEKTAYYTIKDGTLYVESPVALAGVQVQLATEENQTIIVCDDMKGLEQTSAWLSNCDYMFLAYSMIGKTLEPGKHAVLQVGNSKIVNIRLSDSNGHNVKALGDYATRVNRLTTDAHKVMGIYNMSGQKVSANGDDLSRLPKGVYIVNGKKVVR
ncbi:MAG: S8 family serine peptidase [Prevotella sp.]|nr:S8 family serine peptidase [Prevotella sp.]